MPCIQEVTGGVGVIDTVVRETICARSDAGAVLWRELEAHLRPTKYDQYPKLCILLVIAFVVFRLEHSQNQIPTTCSFSKPVAPSRTCKAGHGQGAMQGKRKWPGRP